MGLEQVCGGIPIKDLPRVIVYPFLQFSYLGRGNRIKIASFRVMPAHHLVLVFVRSALPG